MLGTAAAGSTVKIYTNATCTSAIAATGTAANFASPGLTVAVVDNTSTTYYTTATDAALNASVCSTANVTYVEDSIAPVAPTALTTTPGSPANNNTPSVLGTGEAGSTIKLYTNATCTSSIAATGTAANFAAPGLTVTVADDSSTTYYATATDAAGNASVCSTANVTYVEDSTPPGAPTGLTTSPASPANNNNPSVLGTAQTGSTVKLFTNATCTSASPPPAPPPTSQRPA